MMTNERTIREGLVDLLKTKQERLVNIALAKLHLPTNCRHRDDFYQEGCLAYARAYLAFKGDPVTERDRFYAYAYRRIQWRLIDCYRASLNKVETRECAPTDPATGVDWLEARVDPGASRQMRAVDFQHDWTQYLAALAPRQRRYLILALNNWTNAEIAREMGISRTTVYELRRRALAALRREMEK